MHERASRYTQDEMIRCAWLYYEQEWTQEEIARKLGMNRTRVVRLLREAKVQGLVQIKINAPVTLLALAEKLQTLYSPLNLNRVHLVPTTADDSEQKMLVARELASVFMPRRDDIIAVSWGTTLSYAIDILPTQRITGLTVVSVLGGIQGGSHTANPYDIAFRLGQRLHAGVYTIQAPAFVREPEVAALLKREQGVQTAMQMGKRAHIALFGVGDVTDKSTLERLNAISREERQWLAARGVVGDVFGHFLDMDGNEVNLEGKLTEISMPLEDLKRIPERICLGGGPAKQHIILATLLRGYITTLVTDEATARYLIAHAEAFPAPALAEDSHPVHHHIPQG